MTYHWVSEWVPILAIFSGPYLRIHLSYIIEIWYYPQDRLHNYMCIISALYLNWVPSCRGGRNWLEMVGVNSVQRGYGRCQCSNMHCAHCALWYACSTLVYFHKYTRGYRYFPKRVHLFHQCAISFFHFSIFFPVCLSVCLSVSVGSAKSRSRFT